MIDNLQFYTITENAFENYKYYTKRKNILKSVLMKKLSVYIHNHTFYVPCKKNPAKGRVYYGSMYMDINTIEHTIYWIGFTEKPFGIPRHIRENTKKELVALGLSPKGNKYNEEYYTEAI